MVFESEFLLPRRGFLSKQVVFVFCVLIFRGYWP